MIEPVDERVLIDQAAIDELVGAFDREGPIAPGAMREHDRAELPLLAKLVELDIAAHPGLRHEGDVRMRQAPVYLFVLILALLDVPSRQSVLDFSVRALVLLEDRDDRPATGKDVCDFGAGGCSAHHCDYVPRSRCVDLGHARVSA